MTTSRGCKCDVTRPRSMPVAVMLGFVLVACTSGPPDPPSPPGPQRPDIVLIVTDDQRWDTLVEMPSVRRTVGQQGMTFNEAFVVNPLCCPSRVSILTGQYSHTTGVYSNFPPQGGFNAFDDRSTLATWLDDAGYRTALAGRYLNGYGIPWYVPPGWDRWMAFLQGRSPYFDYEMSLNGKRQAFGSAESDYSTDVLAGLAEGFIDDTPEDEPLFLYLAPSAPHQPQIVPPRYAEARPRTSFDPGPNIREPDVSDKPAYIRRLPRGSADASAEWDQQALALRAVDDLVVRVMDALHERGRLNRTLIIFTSDNGFAVGEHRWHYKLTPYEESIRVPLMIRYDSMTGGTSSDALVANVDLAPTIAEIAGVEAPGSEGRSLVDLLLGEVSGVRSGLLIEHLQYRDGSGRPDPPTYCALRTSRRLFVHYATGEEELYDLRADPYELTNLAGDPGERTTIDRLREVTTQRCRPLPPGFSWPDA